MLLEPSITGRRMPADVLSRLVCRILVVLNNIDVSFAEKVAMMMGYAVLPGLAPPSSLARPRNAGLLMKKGGLLSSDKGVR